MKNKTSYFINFINFVIMSKMKFGAIALSVLMVISGCDLTNKAKGLGIGIGSGALLGGLVGHLVGKDTKGTVIGAAVGTAVGAGAGYLIGRKMDNAKAAAQQIAEAQVETIEDSNGLQALKCTFDSGILFSSGSSELSKDSKTALDKFASNVLIPNPGMDVLIKGHTDNVGFRGVTSQEENDRRNQQLSLDRAGAVSNYLINKGVSSNQIKDVQGCGPFQPVASNETAAGKAQNRRVEVYLYASEEMIKEAEAGTLQ